MIYKRCCVSIDAVQFDHHFLITTGIAHGRGGMFEVSNTEAGPAAACPGVSRVQESSEQRVVPGP